MPNLAHLQRQKSVEFHAASELQNFIRCDNRCFFFCLSSRIRCFPGIYKRAAGRLPEQPLSF